MKFIYSDDCEKIKKYAESAFRVPSHRKIPVSVPIYAAHLYDAVIIYSRAVTEVLKKGWDIRNGTAIMSEIFNRTFRSIQGFDVRLQQFSRKLNFNQFLFSVRTTLIVKGMRKVIIQLFHCKT